MGEKVGATGAGGRENRRVEPKEKGEKTELLSLFPPQPQVYFPKAPVLF